MANWNDLKASVAEVIKANSNQEITGYLLQSVLNSIISNIGANATFIGIATPTTNPGVPDGKVFYFAFQEGIYANFGDLSVKSGLAVLIFTSSWTITQIYTISQGIGSSTINPISQAGFSKIAGLTDYPYFSLSLAYNKGSIIYYNEKLWRFITNHSTGSFNEEEVEEISLKTAIYDEINNLKIRNLLFLDNSKLGYAIKGITTNFDIYAIGIDQFINRTISTEYVSQSVFIRVYEKDNISYKSLSISEKKGVAKSNIETFDIIFDDSTNKKFSITIDWGFLYEVTFASFSSTQFINKALIKRDYSTDLNKLNTSLSDLGERVTNLENPEEQDSIMFNGKITIS